MTPKLILVTGLPRSGTTAVGAHLGHGSRTAILHEPMNPITGLTRVMNLSEVPGAGGFSVADVNTLISDLTALRLTYRRVAYPRDPAWRKVIARLTGSRPRLTYLQARFWAAMGRVDSLIWKDPLALFCATEVAKAGVPVVVTVRNPYAMAASMKRMKWGARLNDPADRLDQVGRWPDGLEKPKPKEHPEFDRVTNAATIWRVAYSEIAAQARAVPNLHLVDVDQLICDPLSTYKGLYAHLGLGWSDKIAAQISRAYAPKPQNEGAVNLPKDGQAHARNRDLSQVNEYWRTILTEDETKRVSVLTDTVWNDISSMRLDMA